MSFTKRFLRPYNLLAIVLLIYALMVMLGWLTHSMFLVSVGTGYVAMVFNTAFLLALASLGIILSDFHYLKTARVLSLVVIVFSGLVYLQYPLNKNLHLDGLFVEPFVRNQSSFPGRMAASTALTMILAGVALFFNRATLWCRNVRSIASAMVFGFGVIGFLGYLINFNSDYGWEGFVRMAVQTAVCLMLLALALFLQLRHHVKKADSDPKTFFPFYILVLGVLVSLLIWQLLVLRDFEKARRITQIRAEALKTTLDNTFYPLETSLENMARRFALGKYKNYEMWALDSEGYLDDFGGIRRMTWADRDHINRWVYPLANDGYKVMGLNIYKDPDIHSTVSKVLETRKPALSRTIELKSGGKGFVLFTPIFREDQYQGVLTTAIVAKPFFERVARVDGYDLTILEDGVELVSNGEWKNPFTREWTYRTRYESLGVNWEIVLTPTLAVVRENASVLPIFVLTFGITISALLSIAIGFYQKVSQAESKVREVLDWQNAARNSMPLLMITMTADVVIRDVNEMALRLLGYSSEELVGREPFFLYDPEELRTYRTRMEEFFGRKFKNAREYADAYFRMSYDKALERTLISKSGHVVNTVATISQVKNEKGEVQGYVAIYEDVTQRKERERLLKEQEKLILTTSRLASLGEMAAGIAHEVNNPLTIISGYISVLRKLLQQKGIQDVEIERRVEAIDSTVHRIAKIIRGLRTYSRESHDGEFETVSLDTLVEETLVFCQEKFRTESVALESHIEPQLSVKCRPYQISQVIVNLLNNACDAVRDSEPKKVEIHACKSGGGIEVSVMDSGPGIPQDLREKIMQPFFTTKEVGRGIGLGLSISQGIIQGHDGKFYLDEKSPQTRFVFWLPG